VSVAFARQVGHPREPAASEKRPEHCASRKNHQAKSDPRPARGRVDRTNPRNDEHGGEEDSGNDVRGDESDEHFGN
jgi:hypothetical protein